MPSQDETRFRGVTWDCRVGKWKALIRIGEKEHHLGVFAEEASAARVYDEAALRMIGSNASVNFAAPGTTGSFIWKRRKASSLPSSASQRTSAERMYDKTAAVEKEALLRELAELRRGAAGINAEAAQHPDWSEHRTWWRARAGEYYGRSRRTFKQWGGASTAHCAAAVRDVQRNASPVTNGMRAPQAQFHPCFIVGGAKAAAAAAATAAAAAAAAEPSEGDVQMHAEVSVEEGISLLLALTKES